MSPTTRLYAALALTSLAASLTLLTLDAATQPDADADAPCIAAAPVPATPPIDLLTPLADCDDLPVQPYAPIAPIAPIAISPAPISEPDPGAAALLHGRHLVLAIPQSMTWAAGAPKLHRLTEGFTVDYALADAVVPTDVQAQAGARFTLFASDGATCQIEAGPLTIHGRMEGVFLFAEAAPTRAELRETASSMEPDAHVVQAALRGARSCTGVWARRADLPAPIVFGRHSVDADERAQVRSLLTTQPAIAALELGRTEYYADMPTEDAAAAVTDWPTFLDETLELSAWDEIGGPRRYITAQVGSEAEGCGGFGERVALLFLRDGETLIPQSAPGFLDPLALMDIDRDGQLEAITDHGRKLESHRDTSPLTRHYAFPQFDCGC